MNDECTGGRVRGEFRLTGLDCPDCARGVAASVEAHAGVSCASLNFTTGMLIVEADDARVFNAVASLVRSMDYGIEPMAGTELAAAAPTWRSRLVEPAIGIAGVLLLLGAVLDRLGVSEALVVVLSLVSLALCVEPIVRRALAAARARVLDMNVLMLVAVIGALALGDHREAAMIVFLFAIGGVLESRALARTRRSIRDLVALAPDDVALLGDGGQVMVPADGVVPGQVVLVRPGERVALDGEVLAGSSAVNEAPITGESLPVEKTPGSAVYAGTLNGAGALEVRVTARRGDSTLAHIVRLIEEAQTQKAPVQTLVDRFTRWYTPAVAGLAVALAVLPPLVITLVGGEPRVSEWVYRGLVLLVVSCPCALVISTPVAMVSAITRAARDGVLVKGGAFVELAARVKVVAFDKTGTLTIGAPRIAAVHPMEGTTAEDVLAIAAALESRSTHPLAAAFDAAAASTGVTSATSAPGAGAAVTEFTEEAGRGLTGTLDGERYLVGSPAFVVQEGVEVRAAEPRIAELEAQGASAVLVAHGGARRVIGVIGIADAVRDDAALVVRQLRAGGIEHVALLTGDGERVGAAVGAATGVDQVRARLLPADKSDAITRLAKEFGPVAMVGDGINDAPALAIADIGIAMGGAGSDTVLETADVALMSDDIAALPEFFALGRRTLANVRQNIWFSVAVKLAVLVAAVAGYAPLWLAVFADTGVALLVILNGLRLLAAPRRAGSAPSVV